MKTNHVLAQLLRAKELVERYSEDGKIEQSLLHKILRQTLGEEFDLDFYGPHDMRLLYRIDRQLADLSEKIASNGCRYQNGGTSDGANTQLITTGGPSVSAVVKGKAEAREELGGWLADAEEAIIIDPYLFKRSQNGESSDETERLDREYANQILAILGTKVKKIRFIYKGTYRDHISPSVASFFATEVRKRGIAPLYTPARDDLHDRVWLKKDTKGRWAAKVIGTSLDGIGRRPTYIVDMPSDDIEKYNAYVHHLISLSNVSSESPTTLPPARKKRVSNSGKKKVVPNHKPPTVEVR
jgi:hypothetical protein